MDIEAVSGAAGIAIACAMVFLLAARSWDALARLLAGHPSFADSIMSEAAQRFRDELRVLSYRQSTYLGAALVFVVMYIAASAFDSPLLLHGYPDWQLYLFLGTLAAAALFVTYRLAVTLMAWKQLRFLRDANVAVGHQLQWISSGHGRVFHDVPVPSGIVDHVMVGPSGIYALSVIARRPATSGETRISNDEVQFRPTREVCDVGEIATAVGELAHELSKQIGHNVRVRSVIAVPGWDISSQTGGEHLLVNERNLPMLRGWKDQAEYLMNEDVDAIQAWLSARCTRSNQ